MKQPVLDFYVQPSMMTSVGRYGPMFNELPSDLSELVRIIQHLVMYDVVAADFGSLQAEGIGRVVRDAHAKGYGLARGEFEILSGMPFVIQLRILVRPSAEYSPIHPGICFHPRLVLRGTFSATARPYCEAEPASFAISFP